MNVHDVVRLHESTVQNPRPFHPGDTRRRTRNGTVYRVQVDPDVWATAMRLASGDWRRCVVQLNGDVVVHNKPQR